MAAKKQSSKEGKASGFVVGSVRFRKISAVEGIHYSGTMKGAVAVRKAKAVTPQEKRNAITRAYRKA